jgi:hypothetical protein
MAVLSREVARVLREKAGVDVREELRRRWDIARLPNGLGKRIDVLAESIGTKIKTRQSYAARDDAAIKDRIISRTVDAAETALCRASYRRASGKWAGGEHTVRVEIGEPSIGGSSERVWSANGKWCGRNSQITAYVRPSWLLRVDMQGIALVDGLFVLAATIVERTETGALWEVLYGRQSKGFDVRMENGMVCKLSGEKPQFVKRRKTK